MPFQFPIYNYVSNNISLSHLTLTCILSHLFNSVVSTEICTASKHFQVNWSVFFLLCLVNFPYTIMFQTTSHYVTLICMLSNFSFYSVVDPRKYVSASKCFQDNGSVFFIMAFSIFHIQLCFNQHLIMSFNFCLYFRVLPLWLCIKGPRLGGRWTR